MALPPHGDPPAGATRATHGRSKLIRELLWRRVDVPCIEYFRLWESAAGPRLTGTVILADAGLPLRLKYAVACAPDWTSRGVHIALTRGAVTRHFKLTADDDQRWWRSGVEAPSPSTGQLGATAAEESAGAGRDSAFATGGLRQSPVAMEIPGVAGCLDVDLAFTPATNILPLRRLALAVGESREVTAAWIRFPDLSVEPLPQRYTRRDDRLVRYESRGGAFTAELEVDELGLVVRYPPLWERVAVG